MEFQSTVESFSGHAEKVAKSESRHYLWASRPIGQGSDGYVL